MVSVPDVVMSVQGPPDVERCNWYPVMGEPPLLVGAVQVSVTELLVMLDVDRVGADGTVMGWAVSVVVIVWLSENKLLPAEFIAAILYVY